MPCESCAVQFSVFKRKRACCECERYYCSGCLRRGGGSMCAPCRVLSTRPLSRQTITHLKVRDLQCFLQRQNVSTRGCVEKEELVSLCVSHVNSAAYRRHGTRAGSSSFSSLKGLTNNINDFINSAFDLRQPPQTAPPPAGRNNCYNSAHAHASSGNVAPPTRPPQPHPERFTTTPGGETDIRVPVPESSASVSRSASAESARVDTADCFEIEDLDDGGWELVNRPAEPLPNDSDVLLSATENQQARREYESERNTLGSELSRDPVELSPAQRAASELELHRPDSAANTDSASLQDEPLPHHDSGELPRMRREIEIEDPDTPRHIALEQFKSAAQLEALSVKQLKELLARNRVEYRGCLERADLLERAQTLWRNHAEFKDDLDNLPIEECCKICMAAPLECVLLECGHIAACTRCAKQLAECPICRQYVVRAVRFFRS